MKKIAFLLSFVGVAGTAQAQARPVVNAQGYAQCNMGDSRASAGEMSTDFGNRFWSHMGCGYFREAFDSVLAKAPKAAPEEGIPSPLDFTSDLAKCFYASMPYGRTDMSVSVKPKNPNDPKGEKVVSAGHGWYSFRDNGNQLWDIQRAVVYACKHKPK